MSESDHEWCRDVQRDEAVRAAEDAAAVPAIQHRDLPEVVAELRERVARLEASQATIGTGDVFADVQCGSTADEIARLTAERDAARAESERLRAAGDAMAEALTWDQSCAYDAATTRGAIRQRIKAWNEASARVAELEAAQPPRGWMTAEERDLIAGLTDDDHFTEEGQNIAKALLARETPPRVKAPSKAFIILDNAWIAAIRDAGGEVE